MTAARIEALGDCALLISFGERIDLASNTLALAAAAALRAADLPGLRDIAPAYASLCVQYDPAAWFDPAQAESPYALIASRIDEIVHNLPPQSGGPAATPIEIPVRYGGDFGPDLEDLARQVRLSVDEVVARHCAAEYRVAMLGFAPGFPYLLGLDPALHAPRRATPRVRVPTGSVAIGGAQTGIYPRELPGGWLLIGRTPLGLFDAMRDSPALLAPGQRLRFRAQRADEFAGERTFAQ
jgi:KipI family sensor histidine kinase inhibitor